MLYYWCLVKHQIKRVRLGKKCLNQHECCEAAACHLSAQVLIKNNKCIANVGSLVRLFSDGNIRNAPACAGCKSRCEVMLIAQGLFLNTANALQSCDEVVCVPTTQAKNCFSPH